jgi:hypothetical protein
MAMFMPDGTRQDAAIQRAIQSLTESLVKVSLELRTFPLSTEDTFNREQLSDYLRTAEGFEGMRSVDQEALRRRDARPLFGWGACPQHR